MKISKLLLISLTLLLAGLATNAVAQPPTKVGIGISIWSNYDGTSDVAYFAVDGTAIDYYVEVFLADDQYPIYDGEPNLYLPDGSTIDLDNGLSLPTGGSIIYGPYDYNVNLAHLGQLTGADADEVRAVSDVSAISDRPSPASDQDAYNTNNWDIIIMDPNINIEKVGSAMVFCEGDDPNVIYTYYVENTGNETLADVEILDDTCGPLLLTDNGDGDPNLDVGETWTYECEMQVTEETLNLVIVDANGYWTGTHVSDVNEWLVEELPPPVVTVDPPDANICDANDQTFCATVEGGVGPFIYSWTKDGVPMAGEDANCITVSEAGVYCVTVYDEETGCEANDCGTLGVIPTPDCSIDSGPTSLCEDQIGIAQTYCTTAVADGYLWEIIDGNATIDGNDYEPCVDIIPNELGTITLKLSLYNDVPDDDEHCWNSCQIVITVEECGGGFCTFTQGYYGNAGGTQCGGMSTTAIIDAALASGGPVIVGDPCSASITFTSAADIILRLPCGGKPRALPEGLIVDANDTSALKAAKLLKKKKDDRITNTLVGQTVALTLNMRLHEIPCEDANGFDQALGGYVFPGDPEDPDPEDEYICVQKGEEGCIERYMVPESLHGLSINELLIAANMALAGDDELVAGAYAGASFVNELFDECWTIVSCPPEDSCDYCDANIDTCVDY